MVVEGSWFGPALPGTWALCSHSTMSCEHYEYSKHNNKSTTKWLKKHQGVSPSMHELKRAVHQQMATNLNERNCREEWVKTPWCDHFILQVTADQGDSTSYWTSYSLIQIKLAFLLKPWGVCFQISTKCPHVLSLSFLILFFPPQNHTHFSSAIT